MLPGTEADFLQRRMLSCVPNPNGWTQTMCRNDPELILTPSLCLGEWYLPSDLGNWCLNDVGPKCVRNRSGPYRVQLVSSTQECLLMWFSLIYFCRGSSYISPFLIGTDQHNTLLSEAPKSGVHLLCPQAKYLHSNRSIISATSFSKCSRRRLVGENGAKIKPWDPWDVCPGRSSETRQNDR